MKFNIIFRVLIITLAFNGHVRSEYITQINIQQAGVINSVYIKLLENDAPLTVQNFRNYVSDGDYTNSFIHRSWPGFIIQGGGFTFDPALNDGTFSYDSVNDLYPGGLQPVPEDLQIINEFGNSNLRGTLAMANSEWFVNLKDNSVDLDTQNGGYTVFAEILGTGMDVFDGIAIQPVFNLTTDIHPSFELLPLLGYVSGPVTNDNLVLVKSVNEILSITPDIIYGTVTSGANLQPEIVIQNTGVDSISIGGIATLNTLSAPYKIVSDFCSNTVLFSGQRCSFIVLFSPEAEGIFTDDFDVEFPDLGINYLITLSGEGGPAVAEADITVSHSSVDFDEHDVLYSVDDLPYTGVISIRNLGTLSLDLLAIELSLDSDSEFTFDGDCIGISSLAPGAACSINLSYHPMTAGNHTAKLILETSDPDQGLFEIPIFAAADSENDGVDGIVEDASPNNGDGNNDDVLDSRQSDVVSFSDLKGTYVTYASTLDQPFMDVLIAEQSVLDENPDNVIIETGVHEFTLDAIASNVIVEIGLMLPANVNPSAYYVYGPTLDNAVPHWYKFDFDGETGVTFLGTAIITSPSGNKIKRNLVTLKIKNGGRGDSSSIADTQIVVKSGINYGYSSNDGGGLLSIFFLITIFLTGLLMRAFLLSRG